MRKDSRLVLTVLTAACAGSQQTAPAAVPVSRLQRSSTERPFEAIPFRAIAGTRSGAPSDDVHGTVEVLAKELRVVLQSGHMELTASSGARPRRLQAVLAYGDTAHYRARSRSKNVFVSEIRARGDTLVDAVVFSIPLAEDVVLREHYLVLEITAEVNVPGRGWVTGGIRPLLSLPTIFAGNGKHQESTARDGPNNRCSRTRC
jgi:hypothetical protein